MPCTVTDERPVRRNVSTDPSCLFNLADNRQSMSCPLLLTVVERVAFCSDKFNFSYYPTENWNAAALSVHVWCTDAVPNSYNTAARTPALPVALC